MKSRDACHHRDGHHLAKSVDHSTGLWWRMRGRRTTKGGEHDIAREGVGYKDGTVGEGGSTRRASQPPPLKITQEETERAKPGRNET